MEAGDRLSGLEESLIHHVMSFLSPAEVTRLSTLSKRLSSASLSFPTLDFQYRLRGTGEDRYFLDSVSNSLERRRNLETNFEQLNFDVYLIFQRSRLHTQDYLIIRRLNPVMKLLENVINFALDKKIEELNLHCNGDHQQIFRSQNTLAHKSLKRLPDDVFSAKTIKRMKLCGLLFGFQDLILSCPLIEDLHIISCYGLKSIRVLSSCSKSIKAISIQRCSGLVAIHVDEKVSLESFSYISNSNKIVNISIASRKSLKFLKLVGAWISDEWFQANVAEFVSLETLILSECQNLKTMFICNENLKCLELEHCNRLENIQVMVSGLESFSCSFPDYRSATRSTDVNIASCKCLKFLKLERTMITDEWFRNNAAEFKLLETLILCECQGLKSMLIRNESLKCLELDSCTTLENVDVIVSGLESFSYSGKAAEISQINLASCKSLKFLKLERTMITDEWFRNNLAEFKLLETLILRECQKLENMFINNENLKCLELNYGSELENVDVMVSGLESLQIYDRSSTHDQLHCKINVKGCKLLNLQFSGELKPSPPLQLISSDVKNAEICLELGYSSNECRGFQNSLRDFLNLFAHCDIVSLSSKSSSDTCYLIYPEQERKALIPPLYDVKHLKIQVTVLIFKSMRIMELVDSLLWFSPHPESISVILYDSSCSTKEFIIKFYYGVPTNSEVEEDNVITCCSSSPVRCWRHDLTEVAIENFEDCDRTSLQIYFMENAKTRIRIHLDAGFLVMVTVWNGASIMTDLACLGGGLLLGWTVVFNVFVGGWPHSYGVLIHMMA
ncbi:hypothetical protein L484_020068 [Morus notabilis]|uniref:F-box/LRR-repeat protein n=1 Tax=Morus notabilis TaxID=981085 RepID=W9RJD9_9ROSA|nr:hypothetical protein L484_020068 [Morus notabilis]